MVSFLSCLSFAAWIVQVSSHEDFSFWSAPLRPRRRCPTGSNRTTQTHNRTSHLLRTVLELLRRTGPFLLSVQNLFEVLFSFLANRLFFFAYFGDFFGKLECLRNDLSQCFFMEISFFGQFEIVIGYTLFKDSRNLLENF